MSRSKLAVLAFASVMVVSAAVTPADAGVGGCFGFCRPNSVDVHPGRGRSNEVLDALQWVLPRPVVESIKVFLGRGRDVQPVEPPSGPGATTEGVGGCFFGCGKI